MHLGEPLEVAVQKTVPEHREKICYPQAKFVFKKCFWNIL